MTKTGGKSNSDARLLVEIDGLLRIRPDWGRIHDATGENLDWIGRAAAIIERWDSGKIPQFELATRKIDDQTIVSVDLGYRELLKLLYQAREDLRLRTVGPLNMAVDQGAVFDYFDEIRKSLELASEDILFVDPYLDADFVPRYLPYIHSGVTIRLLTTKQKLKTLLPAVDMFSQQHGSIILVRSTKGLHDRYLFLDKRKCCQSGASFKDGATQAPTTLTEITDAFTAIWQTYERFWDEARIERPVPC